MGFGGDLETSGGLRGRVFGPATESRGPRSKVTSTRHELRHTGLAPKTL